MKTLLEKVRAIDKDAADYIQSEVLPTYKQDPSLLKKIATLSPESQLSVLFKSGWEKTPQGAGYWRMIYKRLEENENSN